VRASTPASARARARLTRGAGGAQAMAAGELRAATVLGVVVPLLQQMIVEGRLARAPSM
jgi:hypothetical protein